MFIEKDNLANGISNIDEIQSNWFQEFALPKII